MVMCGNFDDN